MYIRKRSLFRSQPEKLKRHYNLEEDKESTWLANHLRGLQREGKIQVFSHIPLETYNPYKSQRKKNVQKGVNPGVPDYIIVIKGFVIFLELKRKEGGVVSKNQKEWLLALDNKITVSTVCHGYEEAKDYIDTILTRAIS